MRVYPGVSGSLSALTYALLALLLGLLPCAPRAETLVASRGGVSLRLLPGRSLD
jgi:hypothetical protein